jgi:hypothetical protein
LVEEFDSRRRTKKVKRGILLAALLCAPLATRAATIFETPPGSTSNALPVSARAEFTLVGNELTLVLTNLQADPTAVGQALSDISFRVTESGSTLTAGTLTSDTSTEVNIAADGTPTYPGIVVSTGWALGLLGGTELHLNLLGTPTAPEHTIIGPPDAGGVYTSANASIAGNGPHNPFLDQTATFEITIPGITANSVISNVVFSFNTAPGFNVTGECVSGCGTIGEIPEPSSMLFLGGGLLGIGFLRQRRRAA